MSNDSTARGLEETVIDNGCCVGCGACAAVPGSPFRIALNSEGRLEATLDVERRDDPFDSSVCPFATPAANEDVIAAEIFGDCQGRDGRIGYFQSLYFGHVTDDRTRDIGSSGGMGTWIAVELLER